LRLEQKDAKAHRLLQSRLTQTHFASEHDESWEQVRLTFMQRLCGDMAGAKVTAEQATNTREQPYRRSDRVATNGL
jgi:hypothetical protein